MLEVYVWPDGDYQVIDGDDTPPYGWKSDDYRIIEVPDEEDVDDYIAEIMLEVNLGNCCEQRTY